MQLSYMRIDFYEIGSWKWVFMAMAFRKFGSIKFGKWMKPIYPILPFTQEMKTTKYQLQRDWGMKKSRREKKEI